MKYETLPARVLVFWKILAIFLHAALAALAQFILNPYHIVWYVTLWVIGALAVLVCFLYLPLFYISVKYAVTEEQFVLHRGVIFHKTHYLKRDTITFISVYRNPLTPLVNISSLMLTAPGAQVFILCMRHDRAVEIAKELSYEHKFKEI